MLATLVTPFQDSSSPFPPCLATGALQRLQYAMHTPCQPDAALGLRPYAGAFECNCRFWAAYLNPVYWSIYGLVITQLGSFSNESVTGESC